MEEEKEYYVNDIPTTIAALAAINGNAVFPITSKKGGQEDENAPKTLNWATTYYELVDENGDKTGEGAIERIPAEYLEEMEVPQAEQDAFMTAFGQDIRLLKESDFYQGPPE